MAQQSLEELSSIYSEASEFGLTSLGVTEPQQQQQEENDDDIIMVQQHSAASAMVAAAAAAVDSTAIPHMGLEGEAVVSLLETREAGAAEEYFSDQGNAELGGPSSKKRRTNYSYIPEEVKKKVVDYAKLHGTRQTARVFNISEGTIRSWKMRGFNRPNPNIARGRKVTYGKDLDDELHLGLMAMINEQEVVTVDLFTDYAKKIIMERRPDLNFKCSRGWIDKFLNRHRLGVTKSDLAKVMHIVEQSEVPQKLAASTANSNPYFVDLSMEVVDDTDAGGVGGGAELGGTTPCSPPQMEFERRNSCENGSGGFNSSPLIGDDRTPSGYNLYLPGGEVDETLSEREQKRQRDAAKTCHVRDIVGKLDAISTSSATSEQQRLEVVKHAHLHGAKSAEQVYGVAENTVQFWSRQIPNDQAQAQQTRKLLPEHAFVVHGGREANVTPNKNATVVARGSTMLPKNIIVTQGTKLPTSSTFMVGQGLSLNKHAIAAAGSKAMEPVFNSTSLKMPFANEDVFMAQSGGQRSSPNSIPLSWPARVPPLQPVMTPGIGGGLISRDGPGLGGGLLSRDGPGLGGGGLVNRDGPGLGGGGLLSRDMLPGTGGGPVSRVKPQGPINRDTPGRGGGLLNRDSPRRDGGLLNREIPGIGPGRLANRDETGGGLVSRDGPITGNDGAEARVLAWAMELRKSGQAVTFDGLCDQALFFISQDNPGSAYSSTRKWVDQFLDLKVRDILNVQL